MSYDTVTLHAKVYHHDLLSQFVEHNFQDHQEAQDE